MSDDFLLSQILDELRGIRGDVSNLPKELRKELAELSLIEQDVHPKPPILLEGEVILMPATIAVGGTANATLNLIGSDGNPFTIDSTYTVAYAASVAGDVSLGTVNPDGSVTITGVNADPGDVIGCTVTPPNGGTPVVLTPDTLTITAGTTGVTLASGAVVLTAAAPNVKKA